MMTTTVEHRTPYGPGSPFSYFLDRLALTQDGHQAVGHLVDDIAGARERVAIADEQRAGEVSDTGHAGADFAALTVPQHVQAAFAGAARSASPIYALHQKMGDVPKGGRSIKMTQMATSVSVVSQQDG